MLLSPEAFIHVPMLFGKIIEPEISTFRVSLATFEDWDKRAAEAGYGQNWRRSHEDREATRGAALTGRLKDDLWVFAYGSLMWDPAIHIVEIRRATLQGFHRRFCLKAELIEPEGGSYHSRLIRLDAFSARTALDAVVRPRPATISARGMMRSSSGERRITGRCPSAQAT